MRWLTALLPFLLLACADNKSVPSDIIQPGKMQKVLWDMVQTDRFVNTFILPRKDTLGLHKIQMVDAYDKVFSYNGISREAFLNSYKFYLARPDLLRPMFDSISTQAARKRSEAHANAKPDSVKKVELQKRTDSVKRVDSIKKADLVKKADSIKAHPARKPDVPAKTDSLRKRDSVKKAELQKRMDSIKRADRIKRADSVKAHPTRRPGLPGKIDSLRRADSIKRGATSTIPLKQL